MKIKQKVEKIKLLTLSSQEFYYVKFKFKD